jgi:hypothetical protein
MNGYDCRQIAFNTITENSIAITFKNGKIRGKGDTVKHQNLFV